MFGTQAAARASPCADLGLLGSRALCRQQRAMKKRLQAASRASCAIAASSRQVSDASSDGFSTQQLPAARAGATFHVACWARY